MRFFEMCSVLRVVILRQVLRRRTIPDRCEEHLWKPQWQRLEILSGFHPQFKDELQRICTEPLWGRVWVLSVLVLLLGNHIQLVHCRPSSWTQSSWRCFYGLRSHSSHLLKGLALFLWVVHGRGGVWFLNEQSWTDYFWSSKCRSHAICQDHTPHSLHRNRSWNIGNNLFVHLDCLSWIVPGTRPHKLYSILGKVGDLRGAPRPYENRV